MFAITWRFFFNQSSRLTESGHPWFVDGSMFVFSPLGFFSLMLRNKIPFGNRPAPGGCALCCQLRLQWGAGSGILGKSFVSIRLREKGRKSGEDSGGHTSRSWGAEADNGITFPWAQGGDNHSFFQLLSGVLQ